MKLSHTRTTRTHPFVSQFFLFHKQRQCLAVYIRRRRRVANRYFVSFRFVLLRWCLLVFVIDYGSTQTLVRILDQRENNWMNWKVISGWMISFILILHSTPCHVELLETLKHIPSGIRYHFQRMNDSGVDVYDEYRRWPHELHAIASAAMNAVKWIFMQWTMTLYVLLTMSLLSKLRKQLPRILCCSTSTLLIISMKETTIDWKWKVEQAWQVLRAHCFDERIWWRRWECVTCQTIVAVFARGALLKYHYYYHHQSKASPLHSAFRSM